MLLFHFKFGDQSKLSFISESNSYLNFNVTSTLFHIEPDYKMIKMNVPGPGNYGVDQNLGIGSNKIGKYYLSNMP